MKVIYENTVVYWILGCGGYPSVAMIGAQVKNDELNL